MGKSIRRTWGILTAVDTRPWRGSHSASREGVELESFQPIFVDARSANWQRLALMYLRCSFLKLKARRPIARTSENKMQDKLRILTKHARIDFDTRESEPPLSGMVDES